jgi:RNA polymerase sigma factor (sigma-70 family)
MEELNRQFSDKAIEDFRLIDEAVQHNDEQAFAKLLQRYKRPVYHMVLKMVRNVDDAEDLTIESFAKAFKSLHRFKKDFTFSTWLFRIATNNTIDHIRKKKLNTMSIDNTVLPMTMEMVFPLRWKMKTSIRRKKRLSRRRQN